MPVGSSRGGIETTASAALSGSGRLLTGTAATLLWVPTWAGIAFAVLRYRLFEIDLIIRRTLVYALLSAFVAGLYAASITLVQRVTIAATGQQSDVVVVFIVLVAATSLWPANTRFQGLVDRSFKQSASLPRHWRDTSTATWRCGFMSSIAFSTA